MMPIVSLALANGAFVISHFAMSHPLRRAIVARAGERGFLGLYSLLSLALFAWIVLAFRQSEAGPVAWNGAGDFIWVLSSVLTIIATALLIGSLRGNPALPDTGAHAVAGARAQGVFAVTRHPMMWSFALWALAHVLVWPSARTLITAGSMAFLALVGARLQDRKKLRLLGAAWANWKARTSYWPQPGKLAQIPLGVWLSAGALWLAFTGLHVWLAGIPAGAWRWLA